jgi:streptogramin lyase
VRNLGVLTLAPCALLLFGCSASPNFNSSSPVSGSIAGASLEGRVRGGQQPITGASVYLYAVTTTGYGLASTSLLKSPGYVTTDSNGDFSITGDYTCPTGAQVYIYSVGGNPGLASGTNNTAAGLLAGLGACSALTSSTYVVVNEVSTVATAYALAGYATDATHISRSSSTLAATGVANAFASITNLETLGTGVALATTPAENGGNGTVPQSEIDTLANILAACINTTGPSSSNCSTLLSNAKNGSTTPSDTATASINIAHNPGANVTNLIALQGSSPPFVPDLPSSPAPNDFTIAVFYTGGGLNQPDDVAVDSAGNVWVANAGSSPGDITEFSPVGYPLSGSGGYTGGGLSAPEGVVVDPSGYIWVANTNSTLSKFNSNGTPKSTTAYTGGGLDTINDWVVDTSGDIWTTSGGNATVNEFASDGTPVSSTGYTSDLFSDPNGIAIDLSGNVWVGDLNNSDLIELNSSGVVNTHSPFAGGGINSPQQVALDASGNVWTANYIEPGTISEFTPSSTTGTWDSGSSGFSGGGLDIPLALAFDGAGNSWITNTGGDTSTNGSISEFSSSGTALSTAAGFQCSCFVVPAILAIDGSGNVWVTNPNAGGADTGAPANGDVVEFVGAAAPVVTPFVANLITPYGTILVNKP